MSMFTQKHYEAVAKVLAETRPTDDRPGTEGSYRLRQWNRDVNALSAMFTDDNPRFDNERFARVCTDRVIKARLGKPVPAGRRVA